MGCNWFVNFRRPGICIPPCFIISITHFQCFQCRTQRWTPTNTSCNLNSLKCKLNFYINHSSYTVWSDDNWLKKHAGATLKEQEKEAEGDESNKRPAEDADEVSKSHDYAYELACSSSLITRLSSSLLLYSCLWPV